ncbi:hypothetical protein L195_g056210, partial [Trifolium pratense]
MASYYQSSFTAKFSNIASLAFVTVKKVSPRFAGPPAIKILIGDHPPFISMPQAHRAERER